MPSSSEIKSLIFMLFAVGVLLGVIVTQACMYVARYVDFDVSVSWVKEEK